jgi:hypothetical protein
MEQTAQILNISDDKEVKAEAVAVKSQARVLSLRDQISGIVTVKTDGSFLVTVKTVDQFTTAGTIREKAETERKAVYDDLDSFCKDANSLHKRLVAKRDSGVLPYDTLIKSITSGREIYLREEKRKEEEAAAILREQARKEEEERILKEAENLVAEGREEEADEIMSEPIAYVAPVPKSNIPIFDARKDKIVPKTVVKVNDRMKFLSTVKPETLLELLTDKGWEGIESGLSKKAKSLGRAFYFQGCTVTEV